jgi:hypothetical protein
VSTNQTPESGLPETQSCANLPARIRSIINPENELPIRWNPAQGCLHVFFTVQCTLTMAEKKQVQEQKADVGD